MALASTTAENQALDSLSGGTTNVIADTALHTATTGTTGTSENAATGGYARQTTSWNGAGSGSKTTSGALVFSTAGSVAVTGAGGWSAATSGTFGIGMPFGASVTSTAITIAAGGITLSAS